MVALGIVLIALGLIAIAAALFVSEGQAELLGLDLSALSIFLVGVAAGACVIWGISILKWGAKRSIAARRERKELMELQAKLNRAESDAHGQPPENHEQDRHGDV